MSRGSGPSGRVEGWIEGRRPRPPSPLLSHLEMEPPADDAETRVLSLVKAAVARLDRAEGVRLDAAFALLAADAFLTYGVEAASEEEDVEAALLRAVRSLGEEAERRGVASR